MAISQSDIEDKAKEPKMTRTDEGQVMERSVDELIKADRIGSAKASVGKAPHGIWLSRTRPGGTSV